MPSHEMVPRRVNKDRATQRENRRRQEKKERERERPVSKAVLPLLSAFFMCTKSSHCISNLPDFHTDRGRQNICFSTQTKKIRSLQEKITKRKIETYSGLPPCHQKELVRLILEATMQKHGVTKLFVSEAPSTEQLKNNKRDSIEAKLCYVTKI